MECASAISGRTASVLRCVRAMFPPAVDEIPAALRNIFPDLREERRVILFDPGVGRRLPATEDEILGLAQAVQSGAAGSERFGVALLPGPAPDRVDVGVADAVNG